MEKVREEQIVDVDSEDSQLSEVEEMSNLERDTNR